MWDGVSFLSAGCHETCWRPVGASRLCSAPSCSQHVPRRPAGTQPGCQQQAGLLPSSVSLRLARCEVNFSSLLGRVSPPCVPTERFWEHYSRHMLLLGFLSTELALFACWGKHSKGSPFFLLCLPPPNIPYCWGKPFVPRLGDAAGGVPASPLCSLSTKHCRAFSQPGDGEVKAAVAMEILHAWSSAVPPGEESSKPTPVASSPGRNLQPGCRDLHFQLFSLKLLFMP